MYLDVYWITIPFSEILVVSQTLVKKLKIFLKLSFAKLF